MKKFLVLTIFAALLFAVSCGGGESKKVVEEKTQTITAAEGGEIEVAGGAAKIEIPAGALKKDTEISVKLYKTNGFNNKKALASNVVEFGPSGTIFEKPIIVTINAERSINGKTVAAAVMKSDGTWSFSKEGAYAVLSGFDEAGDPIMTTAAGDPIMISNGNLTTAAGDPIMNAAAGDPIMLASAGDPIMTNAAGDPIMNAAAGDPIMMTTGHFSSYTFVVVDEVKEENSNNGGGSSSGKVTCKTVKEWDTLYGDSEDADYDDKEDSSIYCLNTGDMLVYCIAGAFNGADSEIYSIKAGSKEFKCESGHYENCVFEMEQYCGALDGEYEDGYYCEDQGICEKTGEMSKYCASTKGDGQNYFQAGDKKFECTNENVEDCYMKYHEYCGDTVYEEDPEDTEEPGLICRTESEWAAEFSDEEHHQWICETTGLEISICIPDTFDMGSMEEGEFPPFYSIETGGGTILCDPSTADTDGTIGDYATSMDCYLEAEEYCTPL
ncbi:hypothetical protein J5681_09885 [bacterium]|nr:hypothetical protein [bacterium]